MTRHLGWIFVVMAFVSLSYIVGQQPAKEHEVAWKTGNELQAIHHSEETVGVRGTVDRVSAKYTGTHTIRMIADDGAPITVVIMPTVDAAIPHTGDRIMVAGKLLSTGVINVTDSKQISFTVPGFEHTAQRAEWYGRLVNRTYTSSGACRGTLVDQNNHYIGQALVQHQLDVPLNQHTLLTMRGYIANDGTLVVEDLL